MLDEIVEKLKQWIVTVFLWFKSVHIKCHGAYSDTNVGQVASYPDSLWAAHKEPGYEANLVGALSIHILPHACTLV